MEFRASLDAAVAAYRVKNAQFGSGSTSRTSARAGGRDWFEGFVTPGLEFTWAGENHGEIYGRVSAPISATRGTGEAGANSTTSDQPEHASFDDAYIGWKSGALFGLAENSLDLSLGNQPFMVGDGFLIANGTLDGGGRAAYVLGPRAAFEKTAIARINTDPVRADLFHLQAKVDQGLMYSGDGPHTKLVGGNIEWFASKDGADGRFEYDDRLWYLGVTGLHIYDADRGFSFNGSRGGGDASSNRDGLNVVSLRAGGSFIPGWEDFGLFGEWALQRNGRGANGGSVRADAWHLQPQYAFSSLPWSPTLTARYAHFSADSNTNDRTDKSWDPLYSDAGPRGGTTWTQGLIYSQYVGANTNLNSYHFGLRAEPIEHELSIGLAYFNHNYDEPRQASASSTHLMDEIDIYATWETPIPGLTVSPGIAAGIPGAGQRQALGLTSQSERTIWLGQIVLTYAF